MGQGHQLTKKNPVQVMVVRKIINQKPIFPFHTAALEFNKVPMPHSSYQHHFIEELIHALVALAHIQLLHSHRSVVWQNTLQQLSIPSV